MRRTTKGFSIVDFLIIMALLLIVIGIFGPLVKKSNNKAKSSAAPAAVILPLRSTI